MGALILNFKYCKINENVVNVHYIYFLKLFVISFIIKNLFINLNISFIIKKNS